jgi:hypothetical protein
VPRWKFWLGVKTSQTAPALPHISPTRRRLIPSVRNAAELAPGRASFRFAKLFALAEQLYMKKIKAVYHGERGLLHQFEIVSSGTPKMC